jgi:hypothetical protein
MKVSELAFDQCRGYTLQRVEPHPITGNERTRASSLSLFVEWKMEVLSKLGDVEIIEEKPSKLSPFHIKFTNK